MKGFLKPFLLIALFAGVAAAPQRVLAQSPHMQFVVPEGELEAVVEAMGRGYENAWNALLLTEIEATLARADSATRLRELEKRVAGAETNALGTRIAADALALRNSWSRADLRARLAAGEAEALANQARGQGQRGLADSLYTEAIEGYGRVGEKRRLAWVWGSSGVAAFSSGRFARAESLYKEALAARQAIGDEPMMGNSLNALGSTNYLMGRFDEAYRWYQQARAVRERTGQRPQLGQTLNDLGLCAAAAGSSDSAAVWFERALELTVSTGDSGSTASVLINYGTLKRGQGDYDGALALSERAQAIVQETGDLANEAVILRNAGDMLIEAGRYTEAAERLERAAALSAEARQPVNQATQLNSLGHAWLSLGDPQRARPPLAEALALLDSLGLPALRVQVLNNLASASVMESDYSAAENNALVALAAAMELGDSALVRETSFTLGTVAFEAGALGQAREYLERGAAAGDFGSRTEIEDMTMLACVASRQGRFDEAKERSLRAHELATESGNVDYLWVTLLGLGDSEEQSGNVPGALAHYREAASMIDTVRSRQSGEATVTTFANRLFAYEALIHLLAKSDAQFPDSGFATEAFLWSERARARSLLDLLASSERLPPGGRILSLDGAQARLGKDEAMLVYSVGDSSSSLWVLTQTDWDHISLPPRKALRSRTSVLRRNLSNPSRATSRSARRAARALYETLVGPAERLISSKEHIIIAPDGPLSTVPFEALLMVDPPEDAEAKMPKNAYMVEEYQVSYTPSATALAAIQRRTGGGGIVALGDPLFSADGKSPSLEALPHTAAELAEIQQVADKRDMEVLVGAQASRSRLLSSMALADAQVIHIATHGTADEHDPSRSGLWLAVEDGDEPGFLSIPDILGLDLRASMVALSACETGLGRSERGEGVLGLSRAFMASGANSVLVSFWKVNDSSTSILMREFYNGVLKKKRASARSLAEAKRRLLKKKETRSPFHWAAFVLVGADGTLQ